MCSLHARGVRDSREKKWRMVPRKKEPAEERPRVSTGHGAVTSAMAESGADQGASKAGDTAGSSCRCPVWKVDAKNASDKALAAAVAELKASNVIGFPTETVYGLGGNALSDKAIAKIFKAKGRPSNNPLIVHVASEAQAESLVDRIPPTAAKLMRAFWPGPLTIVMPTKTGASNKISKLVTCGMTTVGIRMPSHPVARALIAASGLPIAAPSANRSGKPSPTRAFHVAEDLGDRIAGIVDGGSTGIGLESTVVDCTGDDGSVVILRPGGVTIEMLRKVADRVSVDPGLRGDDSKLKPKSPGMLYTHYAPNAPFVLVDGSREFLQECVRQEQRKGKKVGVLVAEDNKVDADVVETAGRESKDLEEISRNLYRALRAFDRTSVQIIFSPIVSAQGIGAALMNRMLKAAGKRVVKEANKGSSK